MGTSLNDIRDSVRKWLCLPADGKRLVEASRLITAALEHGVPYDEVLRVVNSELSSPPGYKDPQTAAAIMTMQLHQLQHATGRPIESVTITSKDHSAGQRVWGVDIVLTRDEPN